MPSPLAQNERHINVLKDVLDSIELPTRLGLRIAPEFMSFVLVSPNAQIKRPDRFDTSRVIKADQLKKAIWRDIDSENVLVGLLKTAAKIVAPETVEHVARELAKRHRPLDRAPNSPADMIAPQPIAIAEPRKAAPASPAKLRQAAFSMGNSATTSNAALAVPIRRFASPANRATPPDYARTRNNSSGSAPSVEAASCSTAINTRRSSYRLCR